MNIGAKSEPIVEDLWQETTINLLMRSIFSRRTLLLNLSSLSFKNIGLEWQFLDWRVAFFCNVTILLIAFEF